MNTANSPVDRLPQVFLSASTKQQPSKASMAAAPFSIRFTQEERILLEDRAGVQPLGAYIREVLLGPQAQKRRKIRRPTLTNIKIAQALAGLGQSRLAANMNQIAKAANIGVIELTPDVKSDIIAACNQIRELRDTLIASLEIKVEDGQ